MKKDFSKKKGREQSTKKWRQLFFVGIGLSVLLGVSGLIYHERHTGLQPVIARFISVKAWLATHTHHVPNQISQIKSAMHQNAAPPEIHFEFYTALPKMQVQVSPIESESPSLTATTHEVARSEAKASNKTVSTATPFMNPDELAKEVSQHIQPNTKRKRA